MIDRIPKEELPRSLGAQYATGDQWRNNSRKNEGTEPKQKQYPVVDVTGDRSKIRCCKEQYCIGTWRGPWWAQGIRDHEVPWCLSPVELPSVPGPTCLPTLHGVGHRDQMTIWPVTSMGYAWWGCPGWTPPRPPLAQSKSSFEGAALAGVPGY